MTGRFPSVGSAWTTAVALAVSAAGCLSVPPDLSRPASWTAFGDERVSVAVGAKTLPIVAVDTPENRWAALFLAQTIRDACGRRPGVLFVRAGERHGVTNALFVGDGASVTGEAFRVVARNGSVRFTGRADYAVFDWCERALGLRYYCREGKCIERRTEIYVPSVDYSDAPVFERRLIGGDASWARVSKAGNCHRGGVYVHAPHDWFRDGRLKAEHLGIFETGETPMLCYGNPETLDYYCRRIERHIAGEEDSGGIVDTGRKVVTVSPWDAPIKCRCRWCRPLYSQTNGWSGVASPIVWGTFTAGLADRLSRTHPDYMISFLPYLNFCGVPDGLLAAPSGIGLGNCEAEVCTMPGMALLKNPARREKEEALIAGWRKVTGRKVINWHYACWPREMTSAPYVFGRTIRRHYAHARGTTCGSFVCGGDDDPSLALSMYVWARCLWNPDVDVEAVYDGFAERMFGPAAKPMRELIRLQEACWERPWKDDACSYRNIYETSYRPEDVARMKELLVSSHALARSAGDDRSADRIRWYAGGFTRFFGEEALARARPGAVVGVGEMTAARNAVNPQPWAGTTVRIGRRNGKACFEVRCSEPAAARMDFSKRVDDFIWGDDSVTFVLEDGGRVETVRVFKDGSLEGDAVVEVRVSHDAASWTVKASFAISAEAEASGKVRGNVCRWRVGDMRLPKDSRVSGSRYERSRLGTRYTDPDDDPAAFVEMVFDDI